MPDAPIEMDEAIEKMLGGKPPAGAAGTETPAEAAATEPPGKEGEGAEDSNKKESAEASAFEQELIAELDEEDRTAFEQATPEEQKRQLAFMKKQYRRAARQMTELGTLRKAIGTLREAGITNEDLVNLVQSKRGGTRAEAQRVVSQVSASGDGKRGFQRWMSDQLKAEERENLREAEQVVKEVVEDVLREHLEREVKPLRDRLEVTDRERMTERAQSLEAEINALEDELGYPGSLVETYRQEMLRIGLREPTLSVEDLLVRAAGFQTVKAAMLKAQAKAGGEVEGESTPSAKPGAPVIKKPSQAAPGELPHKRTGAISISSALDLLMRPAKR